MTDQKKTTIPDDIKVSLQSLAKGAKVDANILLQELKQIMQTDEIIKTMPEEAVEQKIRFAWALLCRKYTVSGTTQIYIRPTTKPRVRQTKKGKFVGDLIALVKTIDKDESGNPIISDTKLGVGTLWEKAAENMKGLDPKKVYKTDLFVSDASATVGNTKVEGYELGSNNTTFVETTDTTFPTNEEFYKSYFEPKEKDLKVSLGELDLNLAAENNVMDIRIVTGFVLDVGEGQTAKAGEYGRYTITDDSLLGGGPKGMPGSESIFVHPEETIYEKSSTLKFVVSIEFDKPNERCRLTSYMLVPTTVAMKRKIQPKPVAQQSVEVSLDDELVAEHKKIEDSIGDGFTL